VSGLDRLRADVAEYDRLCNLARARSRERTGTNDHGGEAVNARHRRQPPNLGFIRGVCSTGKQEKTAGEIYGREVS
jgi:hypothetical protein